MFLKTTLAKIQRIFATPPPEGNFDPTNSIIIIMKIRDFIELE